MRNNNLKSIITTTRDSNSNSNSNSNLDSSSINIVVVPEIKIFDVISKMISLQVVDFSENTLSGSIPSNMFPLLKDLRVFAVASNCLSGVVPDDICALDENKDSKSNLEVFVISGSGSGKGCRNYFWEGFAFLKKYNFNGY